VYGVDHPVVFTNPNQGVDDISHGIESVGAMPAFLFIWKALEQDLTLTIPGFWKLSSYHLMESCGLILCVWRYSNNGY
jgi:hypothetical protein